MTKHARHCSGSVGGDPCGTSARKLGVRGTPLQEPNTQHAEPLSASQERHGTDSLPPCFSHEPRPCGSASQSVAGATRRGIREEQCPTRQQEPPRASESLQRGNHRDSGAKTTQGRLPECWEAPTDEQGKTTRRSPRQEAR